MIPTNDHWRKALTALGCVNPCKRHGQWCEVRRIAGPTDDDDGPIVEIPIPTDLASLLRRSREREIRYELSHCVHADGILGPFARVSNDGETWYEEFGCDDTHALILALAALHDAQETTR